MKKFRDYGGVQRAQQFLDKLARYAWEPYYKDEPGFPKTTHGGDYYDTKGNHVSALWEIIEKSSSSFRAGLMRGQGQLSQSPQRPAPPHGMDLAAADSGWLQFEFDRIFDVVVSDSVTSVADAAVKTTAYLQTIAESMGAGPKYYLFRGQSNIEYEVIPRLGRLVAEEIKNGGDPPDNVNSVSDRELNDLAAFQKAWPVATADELDLYVVEKLSQDDSDWWILMQHFADSAGDGTRLLDVTTSLLFALLFACVDWETGTVKEDQDGIVYLFVAGQNAVANDYLETPMPEAASLFDSPHDVRHMIINPPHNERSKAQSGGFIWWREFWKPMTDSLPYLRIPMGSKAAIARELLSFGVGPKEAVRGEKGLKNEKTLRAQLGV